MRQEYVTNFAKEEFEEYEKKISKGEKSLEDCLTETIRGLEMRIGLHNSNWFSFQVKDALMDIGKKSINKYPNKKNEIIQLIINTLKSLGYVVDEKDFETKEDFER